MRGTMVAPSRYWTMKVIDSPRVEHNQLKGGYKSSRLHHAQEFFSKQFPELVNKAVLSPEENKYIQAVLLKNFRSASDVRQRALAGLSLRCYVSEKILDTCKKIPHTCKAEIEKLFSYIDLLPFVLNDTGKELVILDSEAKTQLIFNQDGTIRPIIKRGEFFSVEILRAFNPNLSACESLDNWTWRLTQQNKKLKLFLGEFGVRTPSDWGLLCRDIPRSLKPHLEKGDCEIVEVFYAVYRRDRRNSNEKGRCSEPTTEQLQEMLGLLQQRNFIVSSSKDLKSHLKRIAEILRQDTLYRSTRSVKTIPIEVDDSSNDYVHNRELPYYDPAPEDIELAQLKEDCNALFENVLSQAIVEVIDQHIEDLKKSKGYKSFADQFHEGLQLYYQENKSLGEIAKLWGIPWCKARRIFQLENFLDKVQYRTEEKFLDKISKAPTGSRLTTISCDPDYLKNIAEEIRDYVLKKTFKDSKAEIQNGKKTMKNSLFAQRIRYHLNNPNNSV